MVGDPEESWPGLGFLFDDTDLAPPSEPIMGIVSRRLDKLPRKERYWSATLIAAVPRGKRLKAVRYKDFPPVSLPSGPVRAIADKAK